MFELSAATEFGEAVESNAAFLEDSEHRSDVTALDSRVTEVEVVGNAFRFLVGQANRYELSHQLFANRS
ncbi:MAG: hypothetical protein ACI83Y_001649, partial [Candidatus Azotimanducaceae bacterium]